MSDILDKSAVPRLTRGNARITIAAAALIVCLGTTGLSAIPRRAIALAAPHCAGRNRG